MAWFLYTYILFQVYLNDHNGALVALVYIFLVFCFLLWSNAQLHLC